MQTSITSTAKVQRGISLPAINFKAIAGRISAICAIVAFFCGVIDTPTSRDIMCVAVAVVLPIAITYVINTSKKICLK